MVTEIYWLLVISFLMVTEIIVYVTDEDGRRKYHHEGSIFIILTPKTKNKVPSFLSFLLDAKQLSELDRRVGHFLRIYKHFDNIHPLDKASPT